MNRAIVNVATDRYVPGQQRLRAAIGDSAAFVAWTDALPPESPAHRDVPYAFKAFALEAARRQGFRYLLWADASVNPIRPLDPLWKLVEQQGYWFSDNGWSNGEWTWPTAYPDLDITPADNWHVKHVVATCFGLDLENPIGSTFLEEYLRLARTRAFCGPWFNRLRPDYAHHPPSLVSECPDLRVRGHRHDQTAASVLVHRLGMTLTAPPRWIAYHPYETGETVLSVDNRF